MSISDSTMWSYYELLSDLTLNEVVVLREAVTSGKEHPMKVKKRLAVEIATRFWGDDLARSAQQNFENVFSRKEMPEEMEEVSLESGKKYPLVELLLNLQLVPSKTEARRLIQQNAVQVNEQKVSDLNFSMSENGQYLLKVGKRRFKKVTIG